MNSEHKVVQNEAKDVVGAVENDRSKGFLGQSVNPQATFLSILLHVEIINNVAASRRFCWKEGQKPGGYGDFCQ